MISRNISSYKEKHKWNWSRTLVLSIFIVNQIISFMYLIYNAFGIDLISNWSITTNWNITLERIFSTLLVVFGLMFVFYVNGWDILQFFPMYFYIGCVIFWIATSYGDIFRLYTNIGAVTALIFMYEVGIRVKDDNALGLAIYFSLVFVNDLYPLEFNGIRIIKILSLIFGLIYVTGQFKLFEKIENKKEMKAIKLSQVVEV